MRNLTHFIEYSVHVGVLTPLLCHRSPPSISTPLRNPAISDKTIEQRTLFLGVYVHCGEPSHLS